MCLSIALRLLLTVIRIAFKWWQCRKEWVADSTSKLQLHNRLRQLSKLWLNLCSLRWLSPSLSLVSTFKPNGLWILYTGAANGRSFYIGIISPNQTISSYTKTAAKATSNLQYAKFLGYSWCFITYCVLTGKKQEAFFKIKTHLFRPAFTLLTLSQVWASRCLTCCLIICLFLLKDL